jgi:hypothetical protein
LRTYVRAVHGRKVWQNSNTGGWKPTSLTSVFSVCPSVSIILSGSEKQMSVGKIQMLGRLISFHLSNTAKLCIRPQKGFLYNTGLRSSYRSCRTRRSSSRCRLKKVFSLVLMPRRISWSLALWHVFWPSLLNLA